MNAEDAPHFVYELIDAQGQHLYVGCTVNLAQRLANHQSTKDWVGDVVRVEASRYPDRRSALDAERELIELYQPTHNCVWRDNYGGAGWIRRRARMAEAHAAGRPCEDRTCKAGCRARLHSAGLRCGQHGGCADCVGLMPLEVSRMPAEKAAWIELAERLDGVYTNRLLDCTNYAVVALAAVNRGLSFSDLQEMEYEDRLALAVEPIVSAQVGQAS